MRNGLAEREELGSKILRALANRQAVINAGWLSAGGGDRNCWCTAHFASGCPANLLVAAAFVPRLDATGVSQDEILIGEHESVTGQAVLERYFAAGSGTPAVVIAPASIADKVLATLRADPAIAEASLRGGPTRVDGAETVELRATLIHASDSDEALDTVGRLRQSLRAGSPEVLVGGRARRRSTSSIVPNATYGRSCR